MSILFSRRSRCAITVAPLAGLAIAAATSTLGAQLRPLDPLDWPAMHADVVASGMIGGGRFANQRLGVAGTMGRLTELGNFGLAWHTGRVLLDVGGTMQRVFHDESIFRGPLPDVRGRELGRRGLATDGVARHRSRPGADADGARGRCRARPCRAP